MISKNLYIFIYLFSLNCKICNAQKLAARECEKIKKNFPASMGNYIVGGRYAELGELPYVVALALDVPNGPKYHCGGALVSSTCVVTAAHCVSIVGPDVGIIVRAGTIDISDPTFNPDTDHYVVKRVSHEKFDWSKKYYDIAVLCVENPIELSRNVYPVCLDQSLEQPTVQLTIAGWGRTAVNGNSSTILKRATVEAVSRSTCQVSYADFRDVLPNGITPKLICAKDRENLQDGCQGDSGGPLMIAADDGSSILVGVTTFGIGCASGHPSVYTRISRFLEFIEKYVFTKETST